jgi:hypothetical protein
LPLSNNLKYLQLFYKGGIKMAWTKSEDFKFEVEEFIGTIKESDKHDWCKAIARISWNEKPATLDIRNMNLAQNKAGKGISLSNEEADNVVDILLDNDYGSLETIEKALKKKKNRFTISQAADSMFDEDSDDGKYHIDINL